MKYSKLPLYALAGITLFSVLSACGRLREGRYQGFEYAIMNDQRMGSQTVFLEIKQSGDELVTGTWQSSTSTGTFQGFLRGDRIENIELHRGASTQQNTTTNTVPMGSDPCQGRYVGALQVSDSRISGKLNWSAGFGLMNSMTGYNYSGCTALEVDVSQLSN